VVDWSVRPKRSVKTWYTALPRQSAGVAEDFVSEAEAFHGGPVGTEDEGVEEAGDGDEALI